MPFIEAVLFVQRNRAMLAQAQRRLSAIAEILVCWSSCLLWKHLLF